MEKEYQSIVIIDRTDELVCDMKEKLSELKGTVTYCFTDPNALLRSNEFTCADVFIVGFDLDKYDGRKLYFAQKDRIQIVPFLFVTDYQMADRDFEILRSIYEKDLFDYIARPFSKSRFVHKVNLMLTITKMYNMHMISTSAGVREFWFELIRQDRKMIEKLRETFFQENKKITD